MFHAGPAFAQSPIHFGRIESDNMGGYGSGRCTRPNTKPTVERFNVLDVAWCVRNGVLNPGSSGTLTWTNRRSGLVDSIGYRAGDFGLHLAYRLNGSETVEQDIQVETTFPHFGGERLWWTCGLSRRGIVCGRRVGMLYLKGRYFGCRHCHDLRYYSSQIAHQQERLLGCVDSARRALGRRA